MSKACERVAMRHIEGAFAKAEKHYGRKFPRPKVVIKETTSKAGHACGGSEIMVSSYWYRVQGAKGMKDTCYHEVAHAIVHHLHGRVSRPHGDEWKRVMRVCFDMKPNRCVQMRPGDWLKKLKTRKLRKRTRTVKPVNAVKPVKRVKKAKPDKHGLLARLKRLKELLENIF